MKTPLIAVAGIAAVAVAFTASARVTAARNAPVTVLTQRGIGPIETTSIRVPELTQLLAGKNPHQRKLAQPKAGYWIRIGARYPDPVIALDQQYQA
jgi:hypothetical protein